MPNLASNLVGKSINGWLVKDKLLKSLGTSGGNFSSGYVVEHTDGRKAFMKAINIAYAVQMFGSANRTDLINQITADYKYERSSRSMRPAQDGPRGGCDRQR